MHQSFHVHIETNVWHFYDKVNNSMYIHVEYFGFNRESNQHPIACQPNKLTLRHRSQKFSNGFFQKNIYKWFLIILISKKVFLQ